MTGEDLIRKAIHSDSTEELLELSKVVDPKVRYQVLLRYGLPPEGIRNAVNIAIRRGVEGISDDGAEVDYEAETEILVEAAGMPETPSDILEKLLEMYDFPWHVLTNPGLSDAFLRKALHNDQCRWDEYGEIVEMLIAGHPNATADTLGQIWEKVSVLPPEEIAKTPSTYRDAYYGPFEVMVPLAIHRNTTATIRENAENAVKQVLSSHWRNKDSAPHNFQWQADSVHGMIREYPDPDWGAIGRLTDWLEEHPAN